jgi:protochlorophyllide reductase
MAWTADDIPDLHGTTALVTGANSGLGLETARRLAEHGAHTLLGCRDPERGAAALAEVRRTAKGDTGLVALDLANLSSVRAAAADVRSRVSDRLDILVNNAGVMMTPRGATADGYELQFGTNHLGHAALTWLLAPALRQASKPRVVTVSSVAHRQWGRGFDVDDLMFERRRYTPTLGYGQSKVANLLFAFELDRRAQAAGLDLVSVAAHPGFTDTELVPSMVRYRGAAVLAPLVGLLNRAVSQGVVPGTRPQLYAATAAGVRGGEFYGPGGRRELRGEVKRVEATAQAQDPALARRLWERTAELTGVAPDPA